MSLYAIALIEFDDISPAFPAVEMYQCTPGGTQYLISILASLIPIYLEGGGSGFDDAWHRLCEGPVGPDKLRIAEPVVVNGIIYGPATPRGAPAEPVALKTPFTTVEGDRFFMVGIGAVAVGLTGRRLPVPGQQFTIAAGAGAGENAAVREMALALNR